MKELTIKGRKYFLTICRKCPKELTIRSDYFEKHSGLCIPCGKTGNSNAKKHGKCTSRIYRIWSGLGHRRYTKGQPEICEEWKEFANFEKWANENGYGDDLTIDRIDNQKGYSPKNCQWIPLELNAGKDKIIFDDNEKIKIFQERKRLGLTQREMAARIKVSRNTIQRAEKFAKEKMK